MVKKYCQGRCEKKNYKVEISLNFVRSNLKVARA